jgi:hypothetical protein
MNQGKVLFPVCKGIFHICEALDSVSSFRIAVDVMKKELLIEKDLHDGI